MKIKFIVAILIAVILFLAGNTYRLQRALNEQRIIAEQQTNLVDSLQRQEERAILRAKESLARSEAILADAMHEADSAHKADSVNRLRKTHQKK